MRSVTSKTEYAALAILELARAQTKGALVSAQQIADKYALSTPFMSKVLQILKRAALVTTERGAQGGFRLVPNANEVTVGYVAATIEAQERRENKSIDEMRTTRSNVSKPSSAENATRERIDEIWRQAEIKRQEYLNSISFADLLAIKDAEPTYNYTI